MITKTGLRNMKKFCREPVERIKFYDVAVASDEKYVCHHINGATFIKDELIKMNMYYERPASELVMMKDHDHKTYHQNHGVASYRSGSTASGYGKNREKSAQWKGDSAGPSAKYKRALKLYKLGSIDEDELQVFRDAYNEWKHQHRN